MRERTGGVYLNERGRWRVRITSPEGKRESFGSFATREEAERELAGALAVFSEEAAPLDVAAWTAKWLDARELGRELVDVAGARSLLKNYLAPDPIGAIPLTGLRRADVLAWLRRMAGRRRTRGKRAGQLLARSTVKNALNLLRGSLGAAVDDGRCKSNVAFDVRQKREKRTHDEWHYLDPAQQVRLLAACDKYQWPIVAFAIATGLRAGELVSLRLADVRELEVTVRYGGAPAKPTKTGKIRETPLLALAREAVAAQRALLEGPAPRRVNGRWPNPHGLLFPGAQGSFRSKQHVFPWHVWTQLIAEASTPAGFHWHDLRHTCGTSLVSGWWGRSWSLVEVRDFLGHANVSTTERYGKLAGTALRSAAAEANGHPIGPESLLSQLSATNRPELLSRFRESNSRPTVYEKRAIDPKIGSLAAPGPQWVQLAESIMRALAEGDDATVANARGQLAAFVLSAPLRALGELAAALFDAARPGGAWRREGAA